MRIGIAFDLVPPDRGGDVADDRYDEFDKPETVEAIAAALRDEGHEVVLLGDGRDFLRRVLDDPPDFVWNTAEGEGIGRSREARVPAALEMLGIPYSGSDPLTLAATLDKEVARRLVRDVVELPIGVAIPAGAAPDDLAARLRERFRRHDYPVILKPACEGSSKGIGDHCVADTESEAVAVVLQMARTYRQPILAEQFIDGEEVTVGLVGNGAGLAVLGAMRVLPRQPRGRFVYSGEDKRDCLRRLVYEAPGRLRADDRDRVFAASRRAYQALGCRDVARVDFRLRDGIPYFLEVNPLPGMSPVTGDLPILARGHGIEHPVLIRRILHAALGRVGLAQPETVAP